jgi:phenylacetate-CoA ligase
LNGDSAGFVRALEVFRRAAAAVPAYADFLCTQGIVPGDVRTPTDFAAVPPVTKANYLHAYPLNELAWGGRIVEAGMWSTSSGSSGRPTYWPRDLTAIEQSYELHDRFFRQCFASHERSTLVVIGFAMGNWIGGTYTLAGVQHLRSRGHRVSVITPGINVATILENIADLGPYYDQVVLVGYPPFVKDVLDQAPPAVTDQDIRILMAGENITEAWRDYVLARIGKSHHPDHTCLIYGTADAGIMGHETPTTVRVRRAARDDPAFNRALFGDTPVQPTFVEYEPDYRYVETDDAGFLLFTVDTAFPLIRYRINDRGSTITADALRELAAEHVQPFEITTSSTNSAFIALGQRSDIAATFYALKIFPESVRAALERPDLAPMISGKFRLVTETDQTHEQTLHLHVELRADATVEADLVARVRELVVASLTSTNSEYSQLHQTLGERAEPVVALHGFGTDGFVHDIKHRWTGGGA